MQHYVTPPSSGNSVMAIVSHGHDALDSDAIA
jgi:hypothetical protein